MLSKQPVNARLHWHHTSEQHVEASHARVKRDREDTDKIVIFLQQETPLLTLTNRSSDPLSKTYVDRSQWKYEPWRHVFLWALYVFNITIRQPRCSQISEQGCFVESYSNPSTKINIKSTPRTRWWIPITSHTMVPWCIFSRDMRWLQALRVRQVWKMYCRIWWLHWWPSCEGHDSPEKKAN